MWRSSRDDSAAAPPPLATTRSSPAPASPAPQLCLPRAQDLTNNHADTYREAQEAGNKYTEDRPETQMGIVLLRHPKEGGIDPVGRNPRGAFFFGIEFGLYREDPIRIEKCKGGRPFAQDATIRPMYLQITSKVVVEARGTELIALAILYLIDLPFVVLRALRVFCEVHHLVALAVIHERLVDLFCVCL